MATGKFVSYLRVSTQRQGKSGLGLEAQRQAVTDYLNGGHWTLVEEVVEIESGRHNDRPELARALSLCRAHGARLLIAKLDRLARNVAFIANLMEAGVEFEAVDLPQANRLTLHVMAALAEHEAAAISTRTKAALAAAKARGKQLGGYRWEIQTVASKGNSESAKARSETARKRAGDVLPLIKEICRTLTEVERQKQREANHSGNMTEPKISLRQIAAVLNERGIATARGGQWSAVQVQRVLRTFETQNG